MLTSSQSASMAPGRQWACWEFVCDSKGVSKDSQLIMRRGQSLAVACAVNPWNRGVTFRGVLIDMQPSRASAAGVFLDRFLSRKSLSTTHLQRNLTRTHEHISFEKLAAVYTP